MISRDDGQLQGTTRVCAECGMPLLRGEGGIRAFGNLFCSELCADRQEWKAEIDRLVIQRDESRRLAAEEHAEAQRLAAVLADGRAFWDAVYPHITESGPDLNLADCEAIVRWLHAALGDR